MEVGREAAVLEPSLGGVEHDRVLQVLVAGLTEGPGAVHLQLRFVALVLAGAWDVELQRLAVVGLVEVESGRGAVEADLLSDLLLEVARTRLVHPLALALGRVTEASYLILDTELLLVLHDDLSVQSLSDKLLAGDALARQQSNIWVLLGVVEIESVSCGGKDGVGHLLLNVNTGAHARLRSFTNQLQVSGGISQVSVHVVLSWAWTVLWCHPEGGSVSGATKGTEFNALRGSELAILLDLGQALAHARSVRVIDVDVRAWAWVWGLGWLIAGLVVRGAKWHSNGLLLQQSLLNVIFFLSSEVLTRAGVLDEGLLSVWGVKLSLPHIGTAGARQEWIVSLAHR